MRPKITISIETPGINTTITPDIVGASTEINVSNYEAIYQGDSSYKFSGFQLSSSPTKVASDLTSKYYAYPETGFKGFISKEVYTGVLTDVTFTFIITGDIPEFIVIAFNIANNEYSPNFYLYNARTYDQVSMDNQNAVSLVSTDGLNLQSGDTVVLIMRTWSKLNHSFVVSSIGYSWKLEALGSSIIDFNCSENIMDSELSVQPGICEQYANIKLYDKTNILHALALQGVLNKNERIEISMIDALNVVHVIGVYYVEEWIIENDNSVVNINCRDKSYLFEKINIDRSSLQDRTVHDLLNIVFTQATEISWSYQDSETEERCKNIVLYNNWYLASNLQTMLENICTVGMLRVYWYIDTFKVGRCV